MKILLDTSAYVAFKLNQAEIVDMIINAELVLFSPVVMAELIFGFRSGSRFKKNMAELNAFLHHEAVELVQMGAITADRYARIAVQLKQQGTPIPTNDI